VLPGSNVGKMIGESGVREDSIRRHVVSKVASGDAGRPSAAQYGGRGSQVQLQAWTCAATRALLAVSAIGLAGCGLSTMTSGIGGGMFGGSSSASKSTGVSEEQLLTAAKSDGTGSIPSAVGASAGCPRFVVWPRDHTVTVFEQGRVGDALAVVHRGEITKTARECEVEPGRVTVKYGFSGRILMGPKGRPGNITLPVNVFVTDSKRERVTGEKVTVDAAIAADKPIGYFSVVRSVTVTVPEGSRPGEYEVFVGFERNVPNAG